MKAPTFEMFNSRLKMFWVSRRAPGTIQDSRHSTKCQTMHLTNEHSAPPMIVPKNALMRPNNFGITREKSISSASFVQVLIRMTPYHQRNIGKLIWEVSSLGTLATT